MEAGQTPLVEDKTGLPGARAELFHVTMIVSGSVSGLPHMESCNPPLPQSEILRLKQL